MDQTERQIIDDLFGKLREAEARSGPRDPEAEAYIRDHVARQPAAPYLMAQATVMLEQALATEQARTRDLEQQLRERPSAGGGLFGGLFGGGAQPSARPGGESPWSPQARPPVVPGDPRVAAYANPHHRHGGGFMAGAMQTAVGVAGGMLLGSALGSMFAGDAAAAEPPPEEPTPEEESGWDSGSDFGDEEF